MKKHIFILLCLCICVGCSKQIDNTVNISNEVEQVVIPEEEPYVDDNPIKVGLYMDGKLMNEYNTTLVNGTDIASFDIYFTNEADVYSSNTKRNFKKYYEMYENIDNYKIGFFVSFDTKDKHYEKVITNPDVEMALAPYIFIYLYDDVHQADNAWYSHITIDQFTDDTIMSSIKLCMVNGAEEIVSPITLMGFTYDSEDDFDSDGHYRGISSHTLIINNK